MQDKLKLANNDIKLAKNRRQQTEDQRFLPKLDYKSDHALVAGVKSPGNFPEESIYLDPDAKNDWSKPGIFTRLRISGVQPIFTWGAVGKAIEAAELGIRAVEQKSEATKNEIQILLSELYFGYIVSSKLKGF